jgi:hypothetical protein
MNIFQILKEDAFYGEDYTIEVDKGLHEIPDTWAKFKNKVIRQHKWLKK